MKPLWQTASGKGFVLAIFGTGCIRFVLTLAGLPDSIVKYFSMTAVILVGIFYFGITTKTHTDRIKAAYLLVLPYMVVEVAALGYTWASGRQTIFHSPAYSLGVSLAAHTLGHLVGGLTWEPAFAFGFMEVIWAIGFATRRLVLR